jgi:hypothetical protein
MKTHFDTITELMELKAMTRLIGENIVDMIDSDNYNNEDIKSYINQHLIIANR